MITDDGSIDIEAGDCQLIIAGDHEIEDMPTKMGRLLNMLFKV